MQKIKSQICVAENNLVRPVCPSSTLLLSNAQESWQPTVLEQHRFPPFEQPEVITKGHIISLHLSEAVDFQHNMEGRWRCDRLDYRSVSITPHNTSFHGCWDKPMETIMLRLDAGWLNNLSQENCDRECQRLDLHLGKQDTLLYSLILNIRNEVANNYPAGQIYSDSLLNILGIHLLSKYSSHNQAIALQDLGLSPSRLYRAKEYIEVNFAQQIKLADIAKEVGLSQFYFDRQFKKSTNLTPHQYLTQCRINRAQDLLKNTDLKIGAIAQACGFSSQSYFTRQFRLQLGITPKVYRDRL